MQAQSVIIANDPDNTGGFLLTEEMMNKKFYEITWPGTHNSMANNFEYPGGYHYETTVTIPFVGDQQIDTQNQYVSCKGQLDRGIRLFTLDIVDADPTSDVDGVFAHGAAAFGLTYFGELLDDIKDWVVANPDEIIIVQLGDFSKFANSIPPDRIDHVPTSGVGKSLYNQLVNKIIDKGLHQYIYGFERMGKFINGNSYETNPTACIDPFTGLPRPGSDCYDFSDEDWPTLGEMKADGKRVILLIPWNESHYNSVAKMYKTYKKDWETTGAGSLKYMDQFTEGVGFVGPAANFFDSVPDEGVSYTLYVTPDSENHGSASKPQSERAGSGFRIYETYKWITGQFNDSDKNYFPTYIQVDFYRPGINNIPAYGGIYRIDDISLVDAANRLNIERIHGEDAWNLSNLNGWSGTSSGGNKGYYWSDDLTEIVNDKDIFNTGTQLHNIAYSCNVRGASSINENYKNEPFDFVPSNVIDGHLSSRWVSKGYKRGSGKHDQYLIIDLPTTNISGLAIALSGRHTDAVEILSIQNGGGSVNLNATPVGQFGNTPAGLDNRLNAWWFYDLGTAPTTDRLVIAFENDNNDPTSVYEIAVFSSNAQYANNTPTIEYDCTPVIADGDAYFIKNKALAETGNAFIKRDGSSLVADSTEFGGGANKFIFKTNQLDKGVEWNKWEVRSVDAGKDIKALSDSGWELALGNSGFRYSAFQEEAGTDLYHRFKHTFGDNATDYYWAENNAEVLKQVYAEPGSFWGQDANIDHTKWQFIEDSYKCRDYIFGEEVENRVDPPFPSPTPLDDDKIVMIQNLHNGKFLFRDSDHTVNLKDFDNTEIPGRFKWELRQQNNGIYVLKNVSTNDNIYVNNNYVVKCDDVSSSDKKDWRIAPSPDVNGAWHIGHKDENVKLRSSGSSVIIDLNETHENTLGIPFSVNNTRFEWIIYEANAGVYLGSIPKATVSGAQPSSCSASDGSITFNFDDHPNRTHIEFSLDGGLTYQSHVPDDQGQVTYSNLIGGDYVCFARWGNKEYPVYVGNVSLLAPPEVTVSYDNPTACGVGDGSITIDFVDNSGRTNIELSIDGGASWINLPDDEGSTTFSDLTDGEYSVWSRWGNNDCPQENAVVMLVPDEDLVPPNAICKTTVVEITGPGFTTITVSDIDNGSSDACGIQSLSLSQTDFECSDVGTPSVTLTVTDVNGNTSSCSTTISVEDNVNPIANCQNTVVQLDQNGNGSISEYDIDNGSSDACGIQSMVLNQTSFDCTEVGNNVVTMTVTDNNGKTAACNATVTVVDNVLPIALCKNASVQLDGSGNGILAEGAVDNGSSDACGIQSMVLSRTAFDCTDVGSNTVTLTVTDVNGNVASCNATVTVEDNIAPVLVCKDITITLPANEYPGYNPTFAEHDVLVSSYDACGIDFPVINSWSLDCSDVGSFVQTLSWSDNNGNVGTCSGIVTVIDDGLPDALCQNVTVELDASGIGSTTAASVDNGSHDYCGIQSMILSQTAFDCSHVGANTVTLTVTDNNGNTSSCNATVTVEDNVAPVLVCQDLTIILPSDSEEPASFPVFSENDVLVSANDACGMYGSPPNSWTLDCDDVGSFVQIVTRWDGNGNTVSCSGTVTVVDNTAPEALCQNITVQLDDTGNGSTTSATVDNGSSDLCGIQSMVLSQSAFDCMEVGNHAVTMTVTDVNGNVSSCNAIITVEDNIAPELSCSDVTVELTWDAQGNANAMYYNFDIVDNANDACGMQDAFVSSQTMDCDDIGSFVQSVTVSDVNGNSNSCSATVTVVDLTPPEVFCQNTTVQLDASGSGSITVGDIDNGSFDYCGVQSMLLSETQFDCSDLGAQSVILTVTDIYNNSASCTSSVFVVDNIAPSAICQNITVELDPSGNASITPEQIGGASFDNCSIELMTVSQEQFDCSHVDNTHTVQMEVFDQSGNSNMCKAIVTVVEGDNLPLDWEHTDVGAANGDAFFSPCDELFTLSSYGYTTPTADVQHFAYAELCGDGEFIAHVVSVTASGWAGIEMRENDGQGSKRAGLKTQLGNFVKREVRSSTNGFLYSKQLFRPQAEWLKLVRSGNNFQGYTSIDGNNWQFAFAATISMPSCIDVGLFTESYNNTTLSVAQFENVSLTSNGNQGGFLTPDLGFTEAIQIIEKDFELYPNPTSGDFTIDLTAYQQQKISLEVFNNLGQRVFVKDFEKVENSMQSFDLSHLKEGLYWVSIQQDDMFKTKKLSIIR